MASYLDTVLALGPAGFWRLDETSGTVMSDSSGNGNHGTFFDDCVFGAPSPIETDPGSSAIGGRVGQAPALDSSPLDAANGSTIGGWILYRNDFLAGTATLLCREAQWGVLGGFVDLVWPETPVHNTYYFLVGVRNGAQAKLYVNAELAWTEAVNVSDEYPRHIIGINNGLFQYSLRQRNTADSPWFIGVSGSGNVWAASGVDEPFVFDYTLSDAEILGIYESALNSLALTGYSNVISSAILYSDIEPDPISFPFRHNWSDDWIERISFTTGVSKAVKGYESNVGQRIKPRREIELVQVTKNDTERRMLRAKLNAHQSRKWLIPMLDDRERLITPITAGATTITADTSYRDYEISGYVGLRQLNDAGEIVAWEELLVGALTDTEITTATPVVNNYTNPEVYPVRRAILEASIQPRGHTDSVEEVTILAKLIAEDEKSTPHRIIEWTPAATYKSYEVFPFAQWLNNWTELRDYSIDRTRTDVDHELGSFVTESDTNAASETFSWRIILQTKQQQAEFLGWFYARAGSLNYLWVPTMQRDFEIVSAASSNLTVKGHNYSENFSGSEFRRDLAFIYNDNTAVLRRIGSSSLSGASEILVLDSSVPTLTNLRSVSYLLFCRLDNDTIERAAVTDTKVQFAWLFRELLASPD